MSNKKYSEAGKGDKIRKGISINEWEKKWEKIFNQKKRSFRPHKSNKKDSES